MRSSLVDVLANDTDVDNGAVLTVTAASAPAGQGTASVVGNQVQFDPGTDFDYLAAGESADVVVNYTIAGRAWRPVVLHRHDHDRGPRRGRRRSPAPRTAKR